MREVRFTVMEDTSASQRGNTWSGSAAENVVGAVWALRAVIEGSIDRQTGFVCNIRDVETALRKEVVPFLLKRTVPLPVEVPIVAQALCDAISPAAARLAPICTLLALSLHPSRYIRLTAWNGGSSMIRLTQSYEFSASHRLYCSTFDEEKNQRVFGKCANANGHGHNYVLEVTITGSPDPQTGTLMPLHELDSVVSEQIIKRFDHKHLNVDCEEFFDLNPSVENIARVIWDRLVSGLRSNTLARVRVWETPKTYAECTAAE